MSNNKQSNGRNRTKQSRSQKNSSRGTKKPFNAGDAVSEAYAKEDKDIRDIDSKDMKGNNDPSWYTKVFPAYKDYASLPFSNMAGLEITTLNGQSILRAGTDTPIIPNESASRKVVPGIMTFTIAPTIGVGDSPVSAINIAAQQLYTLVRKENSGAVNRYDKTDLMMVIQAMDSAYMLYEELVRAYRILGSYNYANRYQPSALLQALGFSPELRKSLADFRGIIDLFAYQLESIDIPAEFAFIARHAFLFSNVYRDHDIAKSQFYAYKPDGFYVWKEGSDSEPTSLMYTSRADLYDQPDAQLASYAIVDSLSAIQTAIDTVMQPILGSADIGIMTGDMRKAFGPEKMIKVKPVEDYAVLQPVFNREVLMQMANLQIIAPILNTSAAVTVKYENLTSGPYLAQSITTRALTANEQLSTGRGRLLNYDDQDPTPEMNMVYTRFMNTVKNTGTSLEVTSSGTEICTRADIYALTAASSGSPTQSIATFRVYQDVMLPTRSISFTSGLASTDYDLFRSNLTALTLLSNFDWHPTIYVWGSDKLSLAAVTNLTLEGFFTDMNNYTNIDDATVKKLNDVALMSEYAVQSYDTSNSTK